MSLQVFNVGDRVKGNGVGLGTVTKQNGSEVWAYWDSLSTTREYFMPVSKCVLIEPAMMPYDPSQQGDTEDDI